MIVFDGDSVISPTGFGIAEELTWPHLVAAERTYTNLGKNESTAAKCLMRLWQAIELNPSWYVLQVGQWSQNHETLSEFEKNLRQICEEWNQRDVKIVLVTPPIQIEKRFNVTAYIEVLHKLSKIYKTFFVDLHQYMNAIDNPEERLINDISKCHFNPLGFSKVAEYFNQSIDLDS